MRFSKWHGLGNDYLLIERADGTDPLTPALVARLCDVHRGIGADGVLEVTSVEGGRAEVLIWNPDGSQAELSGNGTRIAARWLSRRSGLGNVVVAVGPRLVHATMRGGLLVEQDLGPVAVAPEEAVEVNGEAVLVTPVDVGNPHAVVEREPERETLLELGPLLERHPRFPSRTNVQLVRIDGPAEITVLVWERGVGETLSSGTSATAAAAAVIATGRCAGPVRVHLPGGDLEVALDERSHGLLTGPAQEICAGEVSSELLAEVAADQTATP
jgi:diaminopimelate epimerase